MPDIQEAVQKMVRVCSGTVCLYWFTGEPAWTALYKACWALLHGTAYPASPKFEVLIRVLRQMGIDPAVEFLPTIFPIRFRSMEHAVDELSPEFNAHTDHKRSILCRHLEDVPLTGGTAFVIPHSYVAVKISWRVQMGVARDIHARSHE
jgi:hypothetical protein